MNHPLMTKSQQSDASSWWSLPSHQALTLRIGAGARELKVRRGRLWLTATVRAGQPSADIWLSAGEWVRLPAGCRVVIEAWPEAHFELLVPPMAAHPGVALRRGLRWLARRAPRAVLDAGRVLRV
ncbi:MAG: DUF2917 domain-containing protein [Pseudomonadota bacterium]